MKEIDNPFNFGVAVFMGIVSTMLGLRMLLKPASLSRNSIMYRYMFRRYFRYLDKEVERTGKLPQKYIQIYGLILAILGLLFFGIALAML